MSPAWCKTERMDPLTAVVLLSLASAGGAVAILQMNDDAVESVEVPLDVFVIGSFPDVCAKTGQTSEVHVAVVERRKLRAVARGSVPATRLQWAQVEGWRRLRRSAGLAIGPLVVVAAAVQALANSVVVDWATSIAVLAVVYLAGFAHAATQRSLPGVRSGSDLDAPPTVTLRRVHPDFVQEVRSRQPSS